MNRIRLLALATVAAVGVGLSGCKEPMKEKMNANRNIIMESGIPADKFIKMDDSISQLGFESHYGVGDAFGMRAFAWEKEVDKLNMKKAFEEGKKFAIDSIANAAEKAKHIK